MSEAKREHNLFRHSAAATQPLPRLALRPAPPAPVATIVELRLVESWGPEAVAPAAAGAGADPYNAVGTLVARKPRPRP